MKSASFEQAGTLLNAGNYPMLITYTTTSSTQTLTVVGVIKLRSSTTVPNP